MSEQAPAPKKRGRPPGRRLGGTLPLRLPPELLEAIDGWARGHDPNLNRSQAARLLIERALAAATPSPDEPRAEAIAQYWAREQRMAVARRKRVERKEAKRQKRRRKKAAAPSES